MDTLHHNFLYCQALGGYRLWEPKSTTLYSAYRHKAWERAIETASCEHLHSPPARNCGCGIYAYHNLATAEQLCTGKEIIGAVAGKGEVEISHYGWRAEVGQLVALLSRGLEYTVEDQAIAERYQVPLFYESSSLCSYLLSLTIVINESERPKAPCWYKDSLRMIRQTDKFYNLSLYSLGFSVLLLFLNLAPFFSGSLPLQVALALSILATLSFVVIPYFILLVATISASKYSR